MKKLLVLLLLAFPAFGFAEDLISVNGAEVLILNGSGQFLIERGGDGMFTVVLEIVSDNTMWVLAYSYADLPVFERDFIDFQGFSYFGYQGDMVVIITKDQSRGEMFASIVSSDGQIDLHMGTLAGPTVISSDHLSGGYQFVISKGMTWDDQGSDADLPSGCDDGGEGATSCSITGDNGQACSVSCGAGYYACCMRGGWVTYPRCRCRRADGAK